MTLKEDSTPYDHQMYLIYITVTGVPESQILQSISLYDQPFSSCKPFWDKCSEWAKNDTGHYKVKGIYYALLVHPGPKFQSVLLYGHSFSSCRPVWDKCTEWTPHDIEHFKVKGTQYMCY